jgi:hypothetical protein
VTHAVTNTIGQERRHLRKGIDKEMRRRNDSNMLTSVNQQTPKRNKGEKIHTVLISNRK